MTKKINIMSYIYCGDNMKRFKSNKRKTNKKIIILILIIYVISKNVNIKFNKSKKGLINPVISKPDKPKIKIDISYFSLDDEESSICSI